MKSEVLETISGTEAEFTLPKDNLFLRTKVISDKPKENPYREGDVFLPEVQGKE